jgi:flagella basal body P-ring formation protein FlgA
MQGASRVSITYAGSLAFDVMRNQAVVASAVAGAIAVEKPMLALADGQVGQSIRVRDPQTSALRTARVVAPGRVALQ